MTAWKWNNLAPLPFLCYQTSLLQTEQKGCGGMHHGNVCISIISLQSHSVSVRLQSQSIFRTHLSSGKCEGDGSKSTFKPNPAILFADSRKRILRRDTSKRGFSSWVKVRLPDPFETWDMQRCRPRQSVKVTVFTWSWCTPFTLRAKELFHSWRRQLSTFLNIDSNWVWPHL